MKREPFIVGEQVRLAGEAATVLKVEKLDDPTLGCTFDMGRYELKFSDGSVFKNMPGYLMARIR